MSLNHWRSMNDSGYVGVAITNFGISDVKSVHGVVGAGYTFNADVIQAPKTLVGVAKYPHWRCWN